ERAVGPVPAVGGRHRTFGQHLCESERLAEDAARRKSVARSQGHCDQPPPSGLSRGPLGRPLAINGRSPMAQAPMIEIAGRKIGPDHPPLVMAEVGINHEGEFTKAIELVDAAAAAGAELVKFQCHITEKEMVPTDMTPGEISKEKLWDIIKRCELTE